MARLLAAEAGRERPAMVFAYHVYHRSPDLIGPALAAGLGVPYVVAEAARSPAQATGRFAEGYRLAGRAIDAAALVFAATSNDRVVLDRMRPAGQRIVDLYPFLDLDAWPAIPRRPQAGPVRLLAVAMMRAGDKAASYAQLAAALGVIDGMDWTLDVVGDGPAGADVRAGFARFGGRVRWHGEVAPHALPSIYAAADLLVWPAVNEAFGMVFLEAQSQGVPCIAGGHGSVADAVLDGVTGRIVPPGDVSAFAAALAGAIGDPGLRAGWSAAARPFCGGRISTSTPGTSATRLRISASMSAPRRPSSLRPSKSRKSTEMRPMASFGGELKPPPPLDDLLLRLFRDLRHLRLGLRLGLPGEPC
eukprot:gene4805-6546_t